MSGNSEKPKTEVPHDYYEIRNVAEQIMHFMERNHLIGVYTSLDDLMPLASVVGYTGSEVQLEGLARFVRLLIAEFHGHRMAYGDGWEGYD